MYFTKAQLFATTKLITELESQEFDENENYVSYHFISCSFLNFNNSNSDTIPIVLIVFFETLNQIEFSYLVYFDGSDTLLPTYGV